MIIGGKIKCKCEREQNRNMASESRTLSSDGDHPASNQLQRSTSLLEKRRRRARPQECCPYAILCAA